jgi:hypothetical protein
MSSVTRPVGDDPAPLQATYILAKNADIAYAMQPAKLLIDIGVCGRLRFSSLLPWGFTSLSSIYRSLPEFNDLLSLSASSDNERPAQRPTPSLRTIGGNP